MHCTMGIFINVWLKYFRSFAFLIRESFKLMQKSLMYLIYLKHRLLWFIYYSDWERSSISESQLLLSSCNCVIWNNKNLEKIKKIFSFEIISQDARVQQRYCKVVKVGPVMLLSGILYREDKQPVNSCPSFS